MEGDRTHRRTLREGGAPAGPVYPGDPRLPRSRPSSRSRQRPRPERQLLRPARPDPHRGGRRTAEGRGVARAPPRRRAAHRQDGQLLRRFHEALPGHQAQDEAAHVVESAQSGLDKHIAEASDHLSTAEADTLRRLVSTLPGLGPLPAGWRHGDFWEHNLLWNGRRCALIDFERSEPGPLVSDFVKLATSLWPDHPELRTALFEGYGRSLSDAEECALVAFAAADAASALAYGPRYGDAPVTARGRATVKRLMQEGRR
ncbi:phosphotransferase [Streptomyces sp. NPDC007916]|uniref:phosphotransferase n=1 Tax=Streptomyces sp. NPDC007916 TaxID=3364792 RepID=UPI0036E2E419